ncbi:MAG: S-layer homology domain-containing protein, partial [Oscillospiraceae bacterium]|nr:S-layer homology domain-containing protein [Oscillospiraceae bacterium]
DDVPANADYAQAVAWAVEKNITSGTGDGNFSPATTCTRGQIVTFLYRAMGK